MKGLLNKYIPLLIGSGLNTFGFFSPMSAGKKSVELFCTPREGRIIPIYKKYLDTAEITEKIETKSGETAAYIWNANGSKTILLIHGWESNAARWDEMTPYLVSEDMRVVAIDAPGHGLASQPLFNMVEYADYIDYAVSKYQPKYITGHSLGGETLAFYLANYEYKNIEKAILMAAPSDLSDMMKEFGKVLGLSKRSMKNIYTYFHSAFKHEVSFFSTRAFCEKINLPTLVIHDKEDERVNVKDSISYHKILKNSKLILTEGYGHSLQGENIFKDVIAFLR